MRTSTEIHNRIGELMLKHKRLTREHGQLDQISMLSGEGSQLREQINNTKGQMDALVWVLKEDAEPRTNRG